VAEILPIALPAAPEPRDRPRRPIPRLAVDARGLARLLSSGLRTVRTWDAGGRIPAPVRVGGRVLWSVPEIREWLAAGAPPRQEWEARKAIARRK
jgi:hypothetical protein